MQTTRHQGAGSVGALGGGVRDLLRMTQPDAAISCHFRLLPFTPASEAPSLRVESFLFASLQLPAPGPFFTLWCPALLPGGFDHLDSLQAAGDHRMRKESSLHSYSFSFLLVDRDPGSGQAPLWL